tara:strand:+ start:405 stop:674 length:270 start_codon:yes stop_codon:yes gene_type:complete
MQCPCKLSHAVRPVATWCAIIVVVRRGGPMRTAATVPKTWYAAWIMMSSGVCSTKALERVGISCTLGSLSSIRNPSQERVTTGMSVVRS